ncbi:hypothetical protein WA158_001696 [Blastocystis sp. Blastoise]
MSMRKLKFHEQKLLKKTDFLSWKKDQNIREIEVLRRYHIENREDYKSYNIVVGKIQQLLIALKKLKTSDTFRMQLTEQLVHKLYNMGLLGAESSLAAAEKINVSSFCRRRLPVVMVRLRMAQNLKEAITLIEQAHIRVGPEVITDPAYIVTRNMEDFVTWVDSSKIKRHIMKYNEKLDDYDLLGL